MAKIIKSRSKAASASKGSTKKTKKNVKARSTKASAGKDNKVKNGDKGVMRKLLRR